MDAKKTMDAKAMVFIGKNFVIAYHHDYFKKNFASLHNVVKSANKIYMKLTDKHNSWIKYREAIQNLPGSYEKRLQTAYETPAFRLSTDLVEIPACYYTDVEGDEYFISPNDGKVNYNYWLDREDIIQEPPVVEVLKRGSIENPIYDVKATFKNVMTDGIFSLNTLFLDFEHLTPYEIIFRDVPLTTIKPLEDLDKETYFNTEIGVYKWAGAKKLPLRRPEFIEEDSLVFSSPVDVNGMVFYNGVYYRHIMTDDPSQKGYGYKIKLLGVEPDQLLQFNLDEVRYIKFTSTDGTDNIKKFELKGLNNLRPNEVEFPMVINNSMITTSGIDATYMMKDKYTIEYPIFDNGMGGDLENDTPVFATAFYAGLEGMGAGLPSGYKPDDAYDIIGNLSGKIEKYAKHKMNDYTDILEETGMVNEFFIKYKPIKDTVRLVINGIRYEENVHFIFNENELKITWLFTEEFGGFDLQDDFYVVAVYDFLFEENGIPVDKIDNFMRDYIKELTRLQLGY